MAYSNQTERSDLKIYSSTDPDRKHIYIEFYVTHASCLKKLHSGNKIIEAKIESLNDISLIKKLGFIEQNATTNDYDESYPIASFYGFNRQNKENTTIEQAVLRVHFSLYETGKTFFETGWATCKDAPERKYETSILEIMFYETYIYSIEYFAMYFGYNKYKINNCALCANYVDSYNIRQGKICRFHKYLKFNKPQPDTSTAKTCQYFHIDEERMNKELSDGPKARYEIVYER